MYSWLVKYYPLNPFAHIVVNLLLKLCYIELVANMKGKKIFIILNKNKLRVI